MEDMPYEQLIDRSHHHLAALTDAARGLWHIDKATWDVDQSSGSIKFTQSDGVTATAPVQIIGTYNPQNSSWWWGWDSPSVEPRLRVHADRVRRYGKQNAITELTDRMVACSEDDCWRFTALACYLNQAQGGYRGPTGGPIVFMTFGTVTLAGAQ